LIDLEELGGTVLNELAALFDEEAASMTCTIRQRRAAQGSASHTRFRRSL